MLTVSHVSDIFVITNGASQLSPLNPNKIQLSLKEGMIH